MNNSKLILFLSCLAALTLTASVVTAAPRGSGGHNFGSMPARGGQTFNRGAMGTFNNRNNRFHRFGDNDRDDRFRRFHNRTFNNRTVFVGSFGFPWWWGWGWGWGWGYPYGYYGYGYPYGYGYGYPYGDGYGYQSGYDSNYYGSSGGGAGYGSDYPTHSRVAELQRRLAQAGYYHGAIDGILGPRTRQAIRAYERDHGYAG